LTGIRLELDADTIRLLIEAAVEAAVVRMANAQTEIPNGRLTLSEAEAADQLGIATRTLAEMRKRGEILASNVAGKIRYTRAGLLAYLAKAHTNGGAR
jgi:hypothetical protein